MKRWLTLGTRTLAISLLLLGAGCGGSVAAEAPTVTAEGVATKAPLTVATHGHVKIAADALALVALRADQRAMVEKLAADAESRQGSVHAARQDLLLALADQVGAGAIDRAALQPKIDGVATAALAVQTADRASLVQLHDLLDPSQRVQFTDALTGNMAGHGHMHMAGEWKERWADLKLTDDQTSQIESILRDTFASHRGEWKGAFDHGKAMLEAFKGDAFAPDTVAPEADVKAKVTEHTARVIDVAQRILPILTADQRSIAATKLRARASATTPTTDGQGGDPLL